MRPTKKEKKGNEKMSTTKRTLYLFVIDLDAVDLESRIRIMIRILYVGVTAPSDSSLRIEPTNNPSSVLLHYETTMKEKCRRRERTYFQPNLHRE